jgi:hypothetical protein
MPLTLVPNKPTMLSETRVSSKTKATPMRQGQGGHTPRKEAGLAMLFRQGLLIAPKDRPYWALDLHAGCGRNEVAGCPGSPVVFLEEALQAGRPFNALFCDNDEAAVLLLRERTAGAVERTDSSAVRVVCQNNALALADFSAWIVAEDAHPELPDPVDVLGLLPLKSHWLVRNPPRGGTGENFLLFLGRNTGTGMEKFEEFYPLDSAKGQAIVRNLARINPEQPLFWEDYP